MVNATIDNAPVSVQLSSSQSTTVPTGEVWKISFACQPTAQNEFGGQGTKSRQVKVNGTIALATKCSMKGGNTSHTSESPTLETVVTEGDTIATSGTGTHIGGFVVNS